MFLYIKKYNMKYRVEQPSVLAFRYNRNSKTNLDDINHYVPTQLQIFANKLIELATADRVLDYFKLCCNYDSTIFVSLSPSNKQTVVDNVSIDDIPIKLFQYYGFNVNTFLYETNSNFSAPNDWYKQIVKYIPPATRYINHLIPDEVPLWHKNEMLLLKYAPQFNPDLYVQLKYTINNNNICLNHIKDYKQFKIPYNEEPFTNEQKDILRLYLTPDNYNKIVLELDASNYDNITNEEIFDLFN